MTHPVTRFLGVDELADERTLLGISDPNPTITHIDAALRAQIGRIHRHPDGNSRDGELVRARLRDAADQLKAEIVKSRGASPSPAGSSPANLPSAPAKKLRAPIISRGGGRAARNVSTIRPTLALTDFDRAALAVMVGCGGWNAESRSRLVSLAAMYGVSVQGLMRIIAGLSDYARSGGAHLGVADIAGPMPAVQAPARRSADIDATSEVLSKLLPEFQEDTLWSRTKIIALFSIISFMAIILLTRLLLSPESTRPAGNELAANTTVDIDPNLPERVVPQPPRDDTNNTIFGPAEFLDPPTFLGAGVPVAVADAADECATLSQHFDEIARKVTITDDQLSEAVYQNWKVSLNTIATGWPLLDDATREANEKLVLDVLFAASQQPSVSDRLLNYMIPPSGPPADPVDLVRGAWLAGMLGRISSGNLPSVVTSKAENIIHASVEPEVPEHWNNFSGAAQRWLDRATPTLVDRTTYDKNAYDYWEVWLSTLRKVTIGGGPAAINTRRFDESLMKAVRLLTEHSGDLALDAPATQIVGRFYSLMDINTSEPMRRETLALFENNRVSPQDLWIITSMLVKFRDAPWMTRELVLAPRGDVILRRRVTDRWLKQWPQPSIAAASTARSTGGAALVDKTLLDDWLALLEQLAQPLKDPSDGQRMIRIVRISRLSEAAGAMLAQDVAAAEPILRELTESLLADTSAANVNANNNTNTPAPGSSPKPKPSSVSPPTSTPAPTPYARGDRPGTPPSNTSGAATQPSRRVGQALGQDGQWAALYAEAARNTTEKQNLLSALRNSAGTDLGPIDAAVFVGEVYRGTPEEVRALAQSVAVDQFSNGPNVAREMLDQFFESPTSIPTAQCISNFTGRILPAVRAPSWKLEARRALVEHRLELSPQFGDDIDPYTIDLTESYVRRSQRAARDSIVMNAPPNGPSDAAEQLRETWNRYASVIIASSPTPADLPTLARRHEVRKRLTGGPVQQFVAAQISVLELLAYVTTAEKPPMRDAVLQLLNDSAANRERSTHSLDQAIEAELAMARVWRIRMGAGAAASPTNSSEGASQ